MGANPVQSRAEERSCPECGNAVNPRAVVCVHCGVPLQPSPAGRGMESAAGLPSNMSGALCYLFTLITGIIFLLIAKDDEFVRFHAKQAIAVGAAYIVLLIVVTVVNAILSLLIVFIPFIAVIGVVLTTLLWFAVSVGGLALVIFLIEALIRASASICQSWATWPRTGKCNRQAPAKVIVPGRDAVCRAPAFIFTALPSKTGISSLSLSRGLR